MRGLLCDTLSLAVPMWQDKIVKEAWTTDRVVEETRRCAQIVAEKGDVIQFKVKGETAKAFNALAEGIALLSFVPGGVRTFGMHFEGHLPGFSAERLVEMFDELGALVR